MQPLRARHRSGDRTWTSTCNGTGRAAEVVAATAQLTLVAPATLSAHLRRADLPRLQAAGRLGQLLARQGEKRMAKQIQTEKLGREHSGLPDDLLNFPLRPNRVRRGGRLVWGNGRERADCNQCEGTTYCPSSRILKAGRSRLCLMWTVLLFAKRGYLRSRQPGADHARDALSLVRSPARPGSPPTFDGPPHRPSEVGTRPERAGGLTGQPDWQDRPALAAGTKVPTNQLGHLIHCRSAHFRAPGRPACQAQAPPTDLPLQRCRRAGSGTRSAPVHWQAGHRPSAIKIKSWNWVARNVVHGTPESATTRSAANFDPK